MSARYEFAALVWVAGCLAQAGATGWRPLQLP